VNFIVTISDSLEFLKIFEARYRYCTDGRLEWRRGEIEKKEAIKQENTVCIEAHA